MMHVMMQPGLWKIIKLLETELNKTQNWHLNPKVWKFALSKASGVKASLHQLTH